MPQSHHVALQIRKMVSDNVPQSRHHGAAKHGSALLAGLLRCRRCGRKLTVRYSGKKARYSALLLLAWPLGQRRGALHRFWRIAQSLLQVVSPGAISAAEVAAW